MPASQHIVPIGRDPRAKRIAEYVNDHFDGNVSQAADAIGCSYDQLHRAANGTLRRGPSLALLTALVAHSGKPLDFWINGT